MAVEIERKFLLRYLPDLASADGEPMVQGYLRADPGASVRLRISGSGAWLTVKGPTDGVSRLEFEYPVPAEDARQMLDAVAVTALVEKIRYRVHHAGYVWEVDVFSGANAGLVLAEVELSRPDETLPLPDWLGREVSADERFYNAALALRPLADWPPAWRDEVAPLLAQAD